MRVFAAWNRRKGLVGLNRGGLGDLVGEKPKRGRVTESGAGMSGGAEAQMADKR
jgi:hypothetical protein